MQLDEARRVELKRNLAALADGERGAFDPVYRSLWPLLVRFIAAVCSDGSLAEEIAVRVWRQTPVLGMTLNCRNVES